jgi:PAS domain S-box-containing protein
VNIKWIVFLTIIIGGFLLYKQSLDYDFENRANLLEHIKIVRSAINSDRILSLKGDESDYTNIDYLRLKEQLTEVGDVIDNARYVYIMAKKDNKTVLLVDTQPKKYGTDGLAIPGEIYEEFDPNIEDLLDESGDKITGPYTDKWGTFVSALASITDKDSNNVIGLVGIDIDAKSWNDGLWLGLITRALTILLIMIIEFVVYFNSNKDKKNQSRLAYLASVLEASGDAIYSVDINEKILSWNVGAEKLYGYTSLEAINNMASEILIPKEKISEMKEDLLKVSQGKKMGYQERVRKNKKGELMTLSLVMSPVVDENNNLLSISVIARDITKQKQKDNELMKSNLELEKMNNLIIDRELAMIELKKKIKKYEITDK